MYQKIFDLQLWHDYYLGQPGLLTTPPNDYDISNLFSLIPTLNCQRILRNLRWLFRSQRYGAALFTEVDTNRNNGIEDSSYTKIAINRSYDLTFWLVVHDPHFANFTNLPLTPLRDRLYYFSNLSNNQYEKTLFLTQPLPSYRSFYPGNTSYRLGQLVTHGGKTWEALEDLLTAARSPNPQHWDALPASQYVSALDQYSRQEILQREILNEHSDTLSLNTLPEMPHAWGLIKIKLNSDQVSPAFSLVRPEQGYTRIQPRTYVIRFKNRSTHWRYRYKRPHGFKPEDLKKLHFRVDATDAERTYFTQRPQGLLQKPHRFLTDARDRWLPVPQVTLIKPEIKDQKTTLFSDIYL
jgi:hypothetical protein